MEIPYGSKEYIDMVNKHIASNTYMANSLLVRSYML